MIFAAVSKICWCSGSKKWCGSRNDDTRSIASLLTRMAPSKACSASRLCGACRKGTAPSAEADLGRSETRIAFCAMRRNLSDSAGAPSSRQGGSSPLCTRPREFAWPARIGCPRRLSASGALAFARRLALRRGCAFLEHLGVEGLELELLLLDDGHVLATRLAGGLVLGTGDVERHLDDDLRVQCDTRLVQA